MSHLRRVSRELAGATLLVIASIPILFTDLGRTGLVNGDEAFYHVVARTMVESGNWFRLEFAGEHRLYDTFTHAPLFLWLKAIAIGLLGDSYWSMRLVSSVFAAITVLLVYATGLELMSAGWAFIAAAVQLTTYQFVFLHCGRTGEMEPLISCFALLAPLLLIRALERGTSVVPHHLCLVALLNLKAALVLVPILADLLFFAIASGHRHRVRDWLRDALWVLPLGAAWHVYQISVGWEPFLETLETMSGQASGYADLPGTALANSRYYLGTLAWGGFPYSLLYPVAASVFVAPGGVPEERHRWRLLGCYALAFSAFFTVTGLFHAWYAIPLYTYLALAVARWLARLATGDLPRGSLALGMGLLALFPWTRGGWLFFDPFGTLAAKLDPRIEWAGCGGLPAWLCATLTFAAVFVGVWLGVRTDATKASAGPGRSRLAWAALLGVALVAFGAVRVGTSLVHTDHVSDLEQFARELAARRAAGAPIRYPVELPSGGRFLVDFFFHRDYEVRKKQALRFELVAPREAPGGDP